MLKFIAFFILISIQGTLYSQKLTIAVAASAQYAIRDLIEQFKTESNVEIDLIVGSSGKLTAQIVQGAPFHIFFSADMNYPNELYKQNLGINRPQVYCYGSLVLWSMKNLDLGRITVLNTIHVKKIAVANPLAAPYGLEAITLLKSLNVFDKVKDKIVYGESVAQVNQYITSENCDIGITSKSSVLSSELKNQGYWKEVDHKLYHSIAQGVIVLKLAKTEVPKESEAFMKFLFSDKGKKILERNGYSQKGF